MKSLRRFRGNAATQLRMHFPETRTRRTADLPGRLSAPGNRTAADQGACAAVPYPRVVAGRACAAHRGPPVALISQLVSPAPRPRGGDIRGTTSHIA